MFEYFIHLGIIITIYVILVTSLNLALGFTGLLNLGHIAFFGIGAYTSALLVKAGVPFLGAFVAAALIAAFFGYVLVLATRKLKGDYLALTTLGFSFVIYSVLLNWVSLTRGPLGIPGIPKPSFFGYTLLANETYLVFSVLVCILVLLLLTKITRSPFGRLLEATRDDEMGLRVLGKNTFLLKAKAMMLSAGCAGIAGSLFAHYISYIDPSSFLLTEIIFVVTIVIVGGIASIKGSVVATILLVLLPEALRFLSLPSQILGPSRQIIYALLLIAILLLRPRGLFGRVDLA